MDSNFEWYIAVKEVEAISNDLREKLSALGCSISDEKVYIHAHFHVPMDYVAKAEELLKQYGFTFQEKHPVFCTVGNLQEASMYEKRVPIIEARERELLNELLDFGVLMSGGAGKPHIHIAIPTSNKDEVNALLKENGYYLKG
ncbi:MAG: hypothetical protein HQK84_09240 [Nitrospinae bacterium]|nr:hypothetical protein [Nitrospinota bacterium]